LNKNIIDTSCDSLLEAVMLQNSFLQISPYNGSLITTWIS